jgi:hypothetical protein
MRSLFKLRQPFQDGMPIPSAYSEKMESAMPSTSTQSSNLDAATIQVAEILSNAAYDSLSHLSGDTNIQQLEAQGWSPVTGIASQTDPTNSYQGIAFYKTINGVVQVVIANRGTVPTSIGDLTMDYDIDHNIQPPSDSSAQAFYQDVVSYFTNQGITNINVIETGHSLGGQEADFVATRGNPPAPIEAVTFDAPGIGPAAQSASSTNAVNISNAYDIIHEFGGTYVGNETTVSAPASTSIDSAVGLALGLLSPDSGMGMLVGGVLGNVVANHALNDIAGDSYDYLANGNVIATDYAPDGTTVADKQTGIWMWTSRPGGAAWRTISSVR